MLGSDGTENDEESYLIVHQFLKQLTGSGNGVIYKHDFMKIIMQNKELLAIISPFYGNDDGQQEIEILSSASFRTSHRVVSTFSFSLSSLSKSTSSLKLSSTGTTSQVRYKRKWIRDDTDIIDIVPSFTFIPVFDRTIDVHRVSLFSSFLFSLATCVFSEQLVFTAVCWLKPIFRSLWCSSFGRIHIDACLNVAFNSRRLTQSRFPVTEHWRCLLPGDERHFSWHALSVDASWAMSTGVASRLKPVAEPQSIFLPLQKSEPCRG